MPTTDMVMAVEHHLQILSLVIESRLTRRFVVEFLNKPEMVKVLESLEVEV